MPTPTYTPLANVTLGSAVNSVTFSSIPATYRDLVLVLDGVSASDQTLGIEYNGDTASNYTFVRMFGTGSGSGGSSGGTEKNIGNFYTNRSMGKVEIFDYSATDKHKIALSRMGAASNATFAVAYRWANTAAITSLKVVTQGGNLNTGTTFALYGVIA
jgi:hypothetical protein